MRMYKQGLVAAMEADEPEVPVDEIETLDNAITADPEGVVEDEGVIDDLSTGIDDAVSDTETLGEISDVIEDSVESGEGLSIEAARIAEIAVQSIALRLGFPTSVKPVPSLESFGSTSSRVTASRIALEGVGSMMKTAWEAIKTAFKTMWAKIVEYYKKMFGEAERLNRVIKSVQATVTAIGSKQAATKSIEGGSIKADFPSEGQVNGKVVQDYLERHKKLLFGTKIWGTGTKAAADEITKSMDEIKKEKDKEKMKALLSDHIRKLSAGVLEAKNTNLHDTDQKDGDKTYTAKPIGPLVGGKVYTILVDKGGEGVTSPYIAIRESDSVGKDAADKGPVAVLSKEEMSAILKDASGIANLLLTLRSNVGSIQAINSQFDTAFTKAIKLTDGDAKSEESTVKDLKELHRICNQLGSATSKIMTMAPGQGFKAAKAALAYVTASAKQYKDAA